MSFEWVYVLVTISAFVFTPELRRLMDWEGHFDPLNSYAVIPLVMLCPVAVFAFRRRSRLSGSGFIAVAAIWTAAFGYAALVALAHGAVLQAIFGVAQFCLPLAVGAWLITRKETFETAHARLAQALLLLGATAAMYGIFQYIVAPPWDTAWMQSVGAGSFGTPERFGIRVFGVLNGPGVFALFLGAVIVLNLPYLAVRRWLTTIALFFVTVALILSLVRTAWLAVSVGVAIFLWLSPRRLQAFLAIVSVATVFVIGACCLLLASPNARLGDQISQRFNTFFDLQDDSSGRARRETSEAVLSRALDQPIGAGLGLTGGSAKLRNSEDGIFDGAPAGPVDNGFVTRFFEMGVPGFALFVSACCASILFVGQAYIRFARQRYRQGMLLSASCIAALVVIFAMNLSGDDQQGLLGVLFFVACGLPLTSASRTITRFDLRYIARTPLQPHLVSRRNYR